MIEQALIYILFILIGFITGYLTQKEKIGIVLNDIKENIRDSSNMKTNKIDGVVISPHEKEKTKMILGDIEEEN